MRPSAVLALLHATHAMQLATQRRSVLKGCGLAIASPLIANADDEPVATEAPVAEEAPGAASALCTVIKPESTNFSFLL